MSENDITVEMLGAMINYAEGSVVSRQVIKGNAGNVTLFAFDKGEGLSEHSAPFDAMVYVIDGKAEVLIDKKPYVLSAGEMIVMPANHPHAVNAVERFKMMLVMIKNS